MTLRRALTLRDLYRVVMSLQQHTVFTPPLSIQLTVFTRIKVHGLRYSLLRLASMALGLKAFHQHRGVLVQSNGAYCTDLVGLVS